ncbi:MAG: 1,4-dihydroxy-2-naphthoyl-CoA synthase [Microbacteriaceae bacterium]|nr:1,4-dihydroxy-2-naphthoyl-CoA synthase [Microbacteriaceae bacterium]
MARLAVGARLRGDGGAARLRGARGGLRVEGRGERPRLGRDRRVRRLGRGRRRGGGARTRPLDRDRRRGRRAPREPVGRAAGAAAVRGVEAYAGGVVSELFDAAVWWDVPGFDDLRDVTYHHSAEPGIARVAFDRPEVRNAFRPETVDELLRVLTDAAQNSRIGVVLLTGNGPSPKDGGWAFCSGGDQRVRGRNGYEAAPFDSPSARSGSQRGGRLHVLEVQRLIRFMPKVVVAVVPGWAAGGGHSLHVVCDLTVASREHARFKQTDATVGSFDAGYGSAYFARQVGQKLAREVFMLAEEYDAERAWQMGAVNRVVPHAELESTAVEMARQILRQSPTAIRMLKFAMNAVDDGLVGQQVFAGETTRLAYATEEAAEGRDAFLEKREPDWSAYPWHF